VTGTSQVLEVARELGIQNLVLASSSSIYGNMSGPFKESARTDTPVSPYAASKKATEVLAHSYHSLYDMNIACLRLFTVYGPRQRPDLAIFKFSRQIRDGEPITFYGDGTTKRDYTYVKDITKGFIQTLAFLEKQETPVFEAINLGANNPIALSDLVEHLQDIMGVRAVLNRLPKQPGDVPLTYADISKAKHLLGYSPDFSLKEGLTIFMKWFLNRLLC